MAAANAAGQGTLLHGGVTDSSARYLLDSFESIELAPVEVGDTDAPELCGSDGQQLTVTNDFYADVAYHEQNATYTLAAPPAQPAPQQQGQAQRYAPTATIEGPCGDPRIHVRMDNSLSTLPAEFKIIYKHGDKDKRIVKRHTLAPGQVFQTGWLWVRGNGNYVRVRDQYQRLLARVQVRDVPAWGEDDCPATGLHG